MSQLGFVDPASNSDRTTTTQRSLEEERQYRIQVLDAMEPDDSLLTLVSPEEFFALQLSSLSQELKSLPECDK